MNPRKGVRGFLYCENKILIVKHKDSPPLFVEKSWNIPGGRIEKNERPEETFYREIKEELDLDKKDLLNVRQCKLIHKYDYPKEFTEKVKQQFTGQENKIFIGEVKKNSKINLLDGEIEDYKFTSLEKINEKILYKNLRKIIKEIISEDNTLNKLFLQK